MARKQEFDWLDDPFNEKKAAQEQEHASGSGASKVALGCGCLVVVVAIVGLLIFAFINMIDVLVS